MDSIISKNSKIHVPQEHGHNFKTKQIFGFDIKKVQLFRKIIQKTKYNSDNWYGWYKGER